MERRIHIGILGGGQLARMTAYAAYRLGFSVAILEKEQHSPAGQLTSDEFVGWVDDEILMSRFAHRCDVITLENEFVDYSRLEFIEKLGKPVVPTSKTISLIQDKLLQKESLFRYGIPVPAFLPVNSTDDLNRVASQLQFPFVLKSRKMGYDGYGNALIKGRKDFQEAFGRLSVRHSMLLAEKFVDFRMELAVMVVRTKREIKAYPIVQTIQKNHICHTVIAPAHIGKRLLSRAREIAVESVKAVEGFGIFGIEMFLTSDNEVLVNEIAPRPHNSGHYTIEGCVTSQFENHVRAVLGFPLGSTEMVRPHAVMINILGKNNGPGAVTNCSDALKVKDIHLHIYGKEVSRVGRKLGHITLIGNNKASLLRKAKRAEKLIII